MAQTIQLDVVTPERQVIAQEVEEVLLPGSEGYFGVLPRHVSMVSALKPGMLKYRAGGEEVVYAIGGGYAEVTPDKIIVLADTAERADDIDLEAARQARVRALAQLKQGLQGAAQEAAEISLKKALARLQVGEVLHRRRGGKTG